MIRKPIRRAIDPVAEYMRDEAGGGIALIIGSALALVWVNLVDAESYATFWGTELNLGIGSVSIHADLAHWVNDALMTLFFFLISLEIKREIATGELREPRRAALPVIAAAGGVLVPIAIFLAITSGTDLARGWGIPMATDAAFALAALTLLGTRVPIGAKVLLVTIAVVDDVMAIAVIAVAYSGGLSPLWIAATLAAFAIVVGAKRLGITWVPFYCLLGAIAWIAMHESGIHATLTGVVLGLLMPTGEIKGRNLLETLEERLHPWVSFVVLPLFALANAGVLISLDVLDDTDAMLVAVGIAAGLAIGKLVGISVATGLAVRLRLGKLPTGMDRRGVIGIAALAGIGFTVSLFITALSYGDPDVLDASKLGILAGSAISVVLGVAILAPGGDHPSWERKRDSASD